MDEEAHGENYTFPVAATAGAGSPLAVTAGAGSRKSGSGSSVNNYQPAASPMGYKRTEDQAALLAATAAMHRRVRELAQASVRKGETLKNIERTVFLYSAQMRSTPAAQESRAPTAARTVADMEEEDEKARVRRDRLASERARAAAEARRVRVIEDAAAQAEPRRAAT